VSNFSPPGIPPLVTEIRPRASLARIVALWLVIVGCTGFIALDNYLFPPQGTLSQAAAAEAENPAANPNIELQLTGRYVVGMWAMTRSNPAALVPVIAKLDQKKDYAPAERLQLAIVIGQVQNGSAASDRIMHLLPKLAANPGLRRDAHDLMRIYQSGVASLPAAQQQRLIDRQGWFGRLALAYHAAPGSPAEQAVLRSAVRTLIAMIGFVTYAIVAGAAGLVLLCLAIIWMALGKVRLAYAPQSGGNALLLESFAVLLACQVGTHLAFSNWVGPPGGWGIALRLLVTVVIAVLPIVWPMLRGMRFAEWRAAVGWHGGRGAWREIGIGILSYIGGLPILIAGIIISTILIKFSGANAMHPIVRLIGKDAGHTAELFLLASVYAPIVEETLFRGALFGYLRGWHGWLISAAITSAIFAGLHPQGWAAFPLLFALAAIFAAVREWRGSILPTMAAHAMNNTVMLLLLTVCLS
jgi:membrane protease YdiL (CAAX protease family)